MTTLQAENNLSDLTNAATARSNLGLGSIATQNASAVAITGGTVTGLTSLTASLPNPNSVVIGDTPPYSAGVGDYIRVYKQLPTGNHASTTRFTAFVGSESNASDTSGDQKGAIRALQIARGSGTATMALLAQTYMEGSSSSAWGAVIDCYLQPGTGGSMKALELGSYNTNSSNNVTNIRDFSNFTGTLWLNSMLNNGGVTSSYKQTYCIAMGDGDSQSGWYYGFSMSGVHWKYIYMQMPCSAGAVGLEMKDHVNWGDAMRLPNASAIKRSDGVGGYRNLVSWTTGQVVIGHDGDAIKLDLSSRFGFPSVKTVEIGAPDSAGTGFRTLRVAN